MCHLLGLHIMLCWGRGLGVAIDVALVIVGGAPGLRIGMLLMLRVWLGCVCGCCWDRCLG